MAIQGLSNIFKIPELKKRLIFTLGMILLYQVGVHLTMPGIDAKALDAATQGQGGGLMNLVDMFTGGAFRKLTVFALGIMPYISASIILQLLTAVWPYLEELSKQGEEGRKKITQYTRYGTVLITVVQSFMLSFYILNMQAPNGALVAPNHGWSFFGLINTFQLMVVLTVTTGTVVIMWIGEQITERGIGNGISLIIFVGIVARFPDMVILLIQDFRNNTINVFELILVLSISIAVTAGIVVTTHAQRRITIKRGQRMMGGGRRMSRANVSYLPIRINTAGVIPVIFASSMLMFPATIAGFVQNDTLNMISTWFSPGAWPYYVSSVVLIIFFCYFYTAITFNPKDVAENLQKYGATVPGYSHGKRTEEYIERILVRVTLAGAVFLAFVAILPDIVINATHVTYLMSNFLGGTSLIIVVGVALDTVNQIENHLRIRNYDGFRKRGKVKGRRL